MSNRWGTRLAVAVSALAVAGLGLVSAGAGAATATTNPGTTGQGTWSFGIFNPNYTEGITHTTSPPSVTYQATVQQPINAPGQIPSVFSNKTRTIPVKYTVTKCTTPGASQDVYPGLLQSYADPSVVQGADPNVVATNLNWTPPNKLTVGQIQSLVANFTWAQGNNHTGSMYWIINTPDGNVWAYYGDLSTTFQTGTGGTGTNLWGSGDARFEATQLGHSPQYDTLANILASPAPTAAYGTIAGEPVNWIGLAVDEGASGSQAVQLSTSNPAVDITTTAYGDATYTPGVVSSGGGSTTCAPDTTDNFWLYLAKVSANTPPAPIDENLIDNIQGDSGGQFRLVNGFYMYNLPLSQLSDLTAQYQVGISPNNDGSNPAGVVQFGLK